MMTVKQSVEKVNNGWNGFDRCKADENLIMGDLQGGSTRGQSVAVEKRKLEAINYDMVQVEGN